MDVNKYYRKLIPTLADNFKRMKELSLLDLESRKGKAPGGYQVDLEEARIPFIFANSVGLDHDVRTLLHESGHAMHSFAWRNISFSPYRHAPMEFCEVASMSMELMADPYLDEFYAIPGSGPLHHPPPGRCDYPTSLGSPPWMPSNIGFIPIPTIAEKKGLIIG